MGPEKKVLYIVQSLVAAYIVTGLLLCLLAFIVYQSNTGTKMANLGITLTYIFASILAGMIIGKKIGKRKFLWGFFVGVLYFAINFNICCVSGKYSYFFNRTHHSIVLMYCWRNFRWNACYLT